MMALALLSGFGVALGGASALIVEPCLMLIVRNAFGAYVSTNRSPFCGVRLTSHPGEFGDRIPPRTAFPAAHTGRAPPLLYLTL